MSWAKLQRGITDAIYALVHLRTMASSMRWPFLIGKCNPMTLLYASDQMYRVVTVTDYPALEKVSESAIKDKQKFERLVVSKEKLLEMFHVRQAFCCSRIF